MRAYVIAEAGVNHGGNLATALQMCEVASRSGVDAIKLQVYEPSKLATKAALAYWNTEFEQAETQQDLFNQHTGLSRYDYFQISQHARNLGLDFGVSVFHVEDVGWLEPMVDWFKIASGDITNTPLLEAANAAGKKTILSTGASTLAEIAVADDLFDRRPMLLHCVLSYPSKLEDANLSAIHDLRDEFPAHVIGFSDHTQNPDDSRYVMVAAYYSGARVFEKHFTLDAKQEGNDHYHSFEGRRFVTQRQDFDEAEKLVGFGGKRVQECEMAALFGARRSWTSAADIPEGAPITDNTVTLKRPGTGIPPRTSLDGRVAARFIPADTTITQDMLL